MNPWLWACAGILAAVLPCGITAFRGALADRLVGLEIGGTLMVILLLLFAEGFHRPSLFDLPLTLALMTFGGGVVFVRFLERWF